jgi:hypothetical protein
LETAKFLCCRWRKPFGSGRERREVMLYRTIKQRPVKLSVPYSEKSKV